jgi:hypothetical protein
MGKFNTGSSLSRRVENLPGATRNFEGGLTFDHPPEMELYTRVATSLVGENKFYESGKTADEKLIKAIHRAIDKDPEFVLKLAVYAREQLYLRSVTTCLLGEYANSPAVGNVPNARRYVTRCIQRPDDMTELVAYQLARNKVSGRKTKLPMMLKNGIASAFPQYDQYRLSKYNRDGEVKLRDVMFLTHPKPRDDTQKAVWQGLIDGTLAPPDTWEVMRSTGKMNWHDVVNQVFYKGGRTNNLMAIVRNLRNVLQAKETTKEDVKLLCKMLTDKDAIAHSKILPFRYFSAYIELRKAKFDGRDISDVLEALEQAAQTSIANIEKLPGTTVIAVDVSGSMSSKISNKSEVRADQIAMLLGMMARKMCEDARVCVFSTEFEWITPPDKDILRNAYDFHGASGGTNGYLVIRELLEKDIKADRVIFLTDEVLYDNRGGWGRGPREEFATNWAKYNQKNPQCKLYNTDLCGYGQAVIPDGVANALSIAGWSPEIFKMMSLLENSGNAIDEIRKISI